MDEKEVMILFKLSCLQLSTILERKTRKLYRKLYIITNFRKNLGRQ